MNDLIFNKGKQPEKLTFKILGEPKPKQSFKYTKKGFKYKPKGVEKEENNIRAQIAAQLPPDFRLLEGPLAVAATFCFSPLKSFNKRQKYLIDQGHLLPKDTNPDTDNLEKLLNDAMQGVLFKNDSQIAIYNKKKVFYQQPCIIVTVSVITDECIL